MKFWNAVLIAAVAVGSCTVAMAGRADVRDREAGFAAFAGFDAWPGVDTAGTNGGGPARLAALLNPPKRRHAWGSNVPGNELLLGLRLAELRRGGVQVPEAWVWAAVGTAQRAAIASAAAQNRVVIRISPAGPSGALLRRFRLPGGSTDGASTPPSDCLAHPTAAGRSGRRHPEARRSRTTP